MSTNYHLKEELALGPFIFLDIGFSAIVVNKDDSLNLPRSVQVEQIKYFTVNGTFLGPVEVEDFLAAQSDKLRSDLIANLEDYALNS